MRSIRQRILSATSRLLALLADDIVDAEKPAFQQMIEVFEKYDAPVIATMQVEGEDDLAIWRDRRRRGRAERLSDK